MNPTPPRPNVRPAVRRVVRAPRVAAVLAASLAIAGCSGEGMTERFIENRIEAETGEKIDLDLSGGNVRIQTEDGVVEMRTDGDGNVTIRGEGIDGGDFEMRSDGDGNMTVRGDGIDGEGNFSMDSDGGDVRIETEDGTSVFSSGGAGVPATFPGSVPLPAGFSPQYSQTYSTNGADSWMLGGEIAGSASELAASYLPQLEAAGYQRLHITESPDAVLFTFDNGTYAVTGIAGDDGNDGTYVNLTVTPSDG